MENQDKQLEELIRDMAEDTGIPVSVHPDAVERRLEAANMEKKRRKKKRYRHIAGAAAACLCLASGIAGGYLYVSRDNPDRGSMMSGASSGAAEDPALSDGKGIAPAESYDEIYDLIREERRRQKDGSGISGGMEENGAAADTGSTENTSVNPGMPVSAETDADHSDTNVREDSVGEADIVKTDGEYLYIVNGAFVEIVGIRDPQMERLAEIRTEDTGYVLELYVEDDTLVVIYSRTEDGGADSSGGNRDCVCAAVYDIRDRADPRKTGEITQSGWYNTMRVKDGYVYVISNFYADTGAARGDLCGYIPEVQGRTVEVSDIYMPGRQMGDRYTVITSFSLEDPEKETDSAAVFGSSGMCYVSADNIYITENWYGQSGSDVTRTAIRRISYKNGILRGEAQTVVDGTLKNPFCIDEYAGKLRLVTTVSPANAGGTGLADFFTGGEQGRADSNSLYVLDEDLEVVGEINDIAEDESVYSARFMGDVGYFVTFKEVDPLFCVDLSDPSEPQIVGELKIPGFSEYLHTCGNGKLLGIGMAVDEKNMVTEGVKLSMFDVSDPAGATELENYVLEDMYGTDAGHDYKSVFIDEKKNLFGFYAYGNVDKYYIFSYGEEGFREVFSTELTAGGKARGLYAGERFYIVSGNTVQSFTMDGFEKVDDIIL